MSQAKVDQKKQIKANKKQIVKKQKMMSILRKTVVSAAAIALVGWIGYSGYVTYVDNLDRESIEVNYDAVNNYLNSLNAE